MGRRRAGVFARRRWEARCAYNGVVLESVMEAIVAVNTHGIVTQCNAAACELLACPHDEMVGRALREFALDRVLPDVDAAVQRALDGIEAWVPAVSLRTRTGENIVAAIGFAPMRNSRGLVVGAVLVLHPRASTPARETRAGDDRIHAVIENAPPAIFVFDADDRYVEVNHAACALLGIARDKVVGRRLGDFTAEGMQEPLSALRAQLARHGSLNTFWSTVRPDGRMVQLEVRAQVLPDGSWHAFVQETSARPVVSVDDDVVVAAAETLAGGLDAALRVVALHALVATNAEIAAVGLDAAPDAGFEHWVTAGSDPDATRVLTRPVRRTGVIEAVMASARAVRISPLERDPAEYGLPASDARVKSVLGVPIGVAGATVGVLMVANKRGANGFTDTDAVALEDLVARVSPTLGSARSIERTARERGELKLVFDDLPEAVLVFDAAGRVTSTNRVGAEFAVHAGAGEHPLDAWHGDGTRATGSELPPARTLATGEVESGVEVKLRTRTGRSVIAQLSASPIVTDTGARIGAVLVIHDVTALREVDRLRDEWLALVAHELKQPLSTIALHAELLFGRASRRAWPEEMRSAQHIRANVRRLAQMISDLMDASRIEARRLTLKLQDVDLRRMLRDAVERGSNDASRPLRLEIDGDLPHVRADASRLDQVMDNLISNAVKYGARETEILVSAAAREASVVVSVRNAGPGLSPTEQERLFERFYRVGRSSAPGSGLGLNIVRGIIEAHGGRVWVESCSAGPTTFRFSLPVAGPRDSESGRADVAH